MQVNSIDDLNEGDEILVHKFATHDDDEPAKAIVGERKGGGLLPENVRIVFPNGHDRNHTRKCIGAVHDEGDFESGDTNVTVDEIEKVA